MTFTHSTDVNKVSDINAGILIVPISLKGQLGVFKSEAILFCENPKFEWIKIISDNFENSFEQFGREFGDIDCINISSSAFIEKNVSIGTNSLVYPNVTVFTDSIIGDNCIVQSGSVIGAIGLGDVWHNGKYHKFVHLGKVIIENDVSIGANVTVLKGMIEDTRIGMGTKIGNNVNIGHNVVIGENCYISSGVTIGGSTIIKDNCWISVGVTINDHVTMETNSKAGTGSVIIKNTLENSFYLGNPARKISERKD